MACWLGEVGRDHRASASGLRRRIGHGRHGPSTAECHSTVVGHTGVGAETKSIAPCRAPRVSTAIHRGAIPGSEQLGAMVAVDRHRPMAGDKSPGGKRPKIFPRSDSGVSGENGGRAGGRPPGYWLTKQL